MKPIKDTIDQRRCDYVKDMDDQGRFAPVGTGSIDFEKILAAKRAGIKEIILCKENEKDVLEIKADYLKGLTFNYVEDMMQVIDIALTNQKVITPKSL